MTLLMGKVTVILMKAEPHPQRNSLQSKVWITWGLWFVMSNIYSPADYTVYLNVSQNCLAATLNPRSVTKSRFKNAMLYLALLKENT